MPQVCSICKHERRPEIDKALLTEQPLRTVAQQFETSATALFRHKRDHLSAALVKAKQKKEAKEEVQAESLFDRLKSINRETLEILQEARESKNLPVALMAINRIEKQLELEARLLGELDDKDKGSGQVVINVLVRKSGYPSDWRPAPSQAVEMKAEVGSPSRFVPRIAGSQPRMDRE